MGERDAAVRALDHAHGELSRVEARCRQMELQNVANQEAVRQDMAAMERGLVAERHMAER